MLPCVSGLKQFTWGIVTLSGKEMKQNDKNIPYHFHSFAVIFVNSFRGNRYLRLELCRDIPFYGKNRGRDSPGLTRRE